MGPLSGIRIIELAGLGPAPFACMLMADLGADVIRVEKPAEPMFPMPREHDFMNRSKRCITLNLKHPKGVETLLKLAETADGFIEGFRPGIAERLGLGPDDLMASNEKLVYGRMTGWGQEGPMSQVAGHDINYISLAGALYPIGEEGLKPQIPLTLVGDFGGGGMMLAFGMVSALLEAQKSGKGQVIDSAMIDGVAALMNSSFSALKSPLWSEDRGTNLLDSGSHFYNTYECADGEYISIGAIEDKFYQELLKGLGLENEELPHQLDKNHWPEMKQRFADIFKSRTRQQWCEVFESSTANGDNFEGANTCFSPILKMSEVADHPHIKARQTMVEVDGVSQPGPAPRFSRTPGKIRHKAAARGEHNQEILAGELGMNLDELEELGVIFQE